jgi:predicted RNA-binding Zn-ribbon protein involved in translation (DUF1610 family)
VSYFTFSKVKIVRACPRCGEHEIERCHRAGVLEAVFCPVFRYWPYRCLSCDFRFFSQARRAHNPK